MATCSGECKVQLRRITVVRNARGTPSTQVTAGGGDAFEGTAPDGVDYNRAIDADVAKRTQPIPLDPKCPSAECRCSVITSSYGPPYDDRFPAKVVKMKPGTTQTVSTTFTYAATVEDGIGTGVCVDSTPKLLSALGVIREGEFTLAGNAETLTAEKLAAVDRVLRETPK